MKRYLKLLTIAVPMAAVVVLGFNNCGRYAGMDQANSSSGNSSLASTSVQEPTDSEALGLPYALLSAEQTLSTMLKATNVAAAPPNVMTEYNARYGALAAGNDLSMANGPLMLGSTSLAGVVCQNVVYDERVKDPTLRVFFPAVNFTTGMAGIDDTILAKSVRGMARSFWGRNETDEELSMMKQYRTDFSAALTAANRTNTESTSNVLTAICAAMLSSVDSITY